MNEKCKCNLDEESGRSMIHGHAVSTSSPKKASSLGSKQNVPNQVTKIRKPAEKKK